VISSYFLRLLQWVVALLVAVVLVAAGQSCATSFNRGLDTGRQRAAAAAQSWVVSAVVSGDTLQVTRAGVSPRTVRVLGLDTPDSAPDCYAQAARAFAVQKLQRKVVQLAVEGAATHAHVRVNGQLYAEQALLAGAGRVVTPGLDADTARLLAAAEREARLARRGLWSACPTSAAR